MEVNEDSIGNPLPPRSMAEPGGPCEDWSGRPRRYILYLYRSALQWIADQGGMGEFVAANTQIVDDNFDNMDTVKSLLETTGFNLGEFKRTIDPRVFSLPFKFVAFIPDAEPLPTNLHEEPSRNQLSKTGGGAGNVNFSQIVDHPDYLALVKQVVQQTMAGNRVTDDTKEWNSHQTMSNLQRVLLPQHLGPVVHQEFRLCEDANRRGEEYKPGDNAPPTQFALASSGPPPQRFIGSVEEYMQIVDGANIGVPVSGMRQ